MRLVPFGLVVLSIACGPQPPLSTKRSITTKIENNYAESIFTVTLTAAGSATKVFDNVRVAGSDVATSPTMIDVEADADFALRVDATSLGEVHSFTGTPAATAAVLTLTYDFDLALAEFSLKYKMGSF